MGDYPNSDEEFELQYGDELDLLNEANDFDEPVVNIAGNSKSRRSLDYGSTGTSKNDTQSTLFSTQTKNNDSGQNNLDNSFTTDFQPLTEDQESGATEVLTDTHVPTSQVSLQSVEGDPPTRKRTIEELFGDIDDILFEKERNAKKTKPESKLEQQMDMIERILELRKQREESSVLFRKTTRISSSERDKQNLSWRVPTYPFVSVTRHDQERIYIRCHSEDYEKEDVGRVINDINFVGVMGDMFKETWKKAQEIINKELDESKKTEDSEMEVEEVEDNELWVDLYKPKRYLELLSDETTNRILLKWLKLWDKVVFNRRPKIRPETIQNTNKPNNKFNFLNIIDNQLKLDEDGRPLYKVALLCGRPGLGKTTLAHVVARHAGYNIIEINASDDRSIESFRTSLENATQMKSVVDQRNRPNCVIFDEIDGAPANSIEFLVKFINGTSVKGRKKEKKGGTVLKRPIICICNDAYVPALRSLRQIAFIINFPPTSSGRLSERLMEICRKQLLNTDVGAMIALAEKSNNDIRSCLSVLHFFKTKTKAITLSDVYRSSIGQKDMQKGLFNVWTDIFSIERAKTKFSGASNITKEHNQNNYDMSYKARMQKIVEVVQSFGDYDRLAQGVFENYPLMQVKDASLIGTCHALNWFCYTDKINKFIMKEQNYSLSSYLPYAFAVWHFQFASLTWPKVKYPNEGYEVKLKLNNTIGTIKEMIKGVQPRVRVFANEKNLLLDTLPLLTRIICPNFRPVNFHLFSTEEKALFDKVVDVMIDYNLTYVQEKNAAGLYEFKLDPDIVPIVTFPNISEDRKGLSYFNKQLLSREIEIRKIKLIQMSTSSGTDHQNHSGKDNGPVVKSPDDKNLPNHLQRLKVKSVKKIEPAVTKDFFGRVVNTPMSTSKGPQLHGEIWYKYKEGYSNAVKKKIKMSSIM